MLGYLLGAIGCCFDSLIWAELGSRFPFNGASYIYLRELYGHDTWGQLFAFIYIWQSWITGPAQVKR